MATVATPAKERVYTVEFEQEDDGRWIAEVRELPGVMVYGADQKDAFNKVKALALKVISEHEKDIPEKLFFAVA